MGTVNPLLQFDPSPATLPRLDYFLLAFSPACALVENANLHSQGTYLQIAVSNAVQSSFFRQCLFHLRGCVLQVRERYSFLLLIMVSLLAVALI